MCRSRRELSNAYFLAKIGFDTADNGHCKVCPLSAYRSPRSTDFATKRITAAYHVLIKGSEDEKLEEGNTVALDYMSLLLICGRTCMLLFCIRVSLDVVLWCLTGGGSVSFFDPL